MHVSDEPTRRRESRRGKGVLTNEIRMVETMPRRQRVIRSPRQAATGGAMLSRDLSDVAMRRH